jgi:2-methylaconitate cis-trans-isomerase PrpF
LSAAVPIFALSEGLIDENRSGSRIFKLFCRNTKKLIEATVDFEKKDTHIDGIAFGSGTSVLLSFLRPGGSVTGNIFPTTLRQEVLGERYPATLIDCANAAVFLHCKHFALRGDEPRNELNSNVKLLQTLEELRAEAAVRMHIASSIAEAKTKRLSTPKICLITEPINYKDVR